MAKPTVERTAKEYLTTDGKSPYGQWVADLKDTRAKAKVIKAVKQMEAGNFGDCKPIENGNGLWERRIDYGPGYRVYYIVEGDKVIVLFAGSDKSDQQKGIDKAKEYLADYKKRK